MANGNKRGVNHAKPNRKIVKEAIELLNLGENADQTRLHLGLDELEWVDLVNQSDLIRRAIKSGARRTNLKVVKSLLEAALGTMVAGDSTTDRTFSDEDGKTLLEKKVKDVRKYIPPNVNAIKLWLESRGGDEWKDNFKKVEDSLNISISVDGKDVVIDKKEKEPLKKRNNGKNKDN